MSTERSLEGRVILVTAAASGMGAASVRRLAHQGATVHALDYNAAALESLADELKEEEVPITSYVVDLLDRDALDRFLAEFAAQLDHLDVLFNHAGIPGPRGLDFDHSEWEQCFEINVWVPTLMTQRLLPLLRCSDAPSIIFTASTSGIVASPNSAIYSSTKAAILGFMRAIAVRLAPEGIRANAICPGLTDTPMLPEFFERGRIDAATAKERADQYVESIPMGRLGTADDAAYVVEFLAAPEPRYLTGVGIPVDGGLIVS